MAGGGKSHRYRAPLNGHDQKQSDRHPTEPEPVRQYDGGMQRPSVGGAQYSGSYLESILGAASFFRI